MAAVPPRRYSCSSQARGTWQLVADHQGLGGAAAHELREGQHVGAMDEADAAAGSAVPVAAGAGVEVDAQDPLSGWWRAEHVSC